MDGDFENPIAEKPQVNAVKSRLGPVAFISMTYFLVCGGAYGTEDLFSAIPPFWALLGIVAVPWFWSLPTALVTAELATAFPTDGGFLLWTREAWGPFLAFWDGWMMTIVVVIDQAIYPVIFVSYLQNFFDMNGWHSYLAYLAYIFVGLCVNLLGTSSVGSWATVLTALTIIPFVTYTVTLYITGDVHISRWFETEGDWDAQLYISVLVWCTCGWEYTGFLAGEVKNPQTRFPLMMFICMAMMVCTYLLPGLATIATYDDVSDITEGSYPEVADSIAGGKWLGIMMIGGGLVSTMGTYASYIQTTSMALREASLAGTAPFVFSYFAARFPHLPIEGILFYTATTSVLVLFDFSFLVQVETFMFAAHNLILMSSLPRLRFIKPDIERPFRLPFGMVGAFLIPMLPACIAVLNIFFTSWTEMIVGASASVLGVVIYLLRHLFNQHLAPRLGMSPSGYDNLEKQPTTEQSMKSEEPQEGEVEKEALEPVVKV